MLCPSSSDSVTFVCNSKWYIAVIGFMLNLIIIIWNGLTRCVDGLSTRNYIVVLGDLNARVGDGELEGVVGKYGVSGENESGERLRYVCGARVGNRKQFFQEGRDK